MVPLLEQLIEKRDERRLRERLVEKIGLLRLVLKDETLDNPFTGYHGHA
jgi:hypothetical protein